jgi:serine-type D-Ala-D-Ala carboxypeptidase (penicillin-binding protein 5/6)
MAIDLKEKIIDVGLYSLIFFDKATAPRFMSRGASFFIITLGLLGGFTFPQEPSPLLGYALRTRDFGFEEVVHKAEETTPFPDLTASSVLVADLKTGRILHSIDSDLPKAPASTAKIMTALVSYDLYSPNNLIRAPSRCIGLEGRSLYLWPGEILSYADLLHGLLVFSANDAACMLAGGIVPEVEFVGLMNEKAQGLGMQDTHFTNPIGYDSFDGSNISTAHDLYLLALEAKRNSLIRSVYSKDSYVFRTGDYPRTIYTTNNLLNTLPGTVGVKTGTTDQAGEVLVYEYSSEDMELMVVVMGSSSRFEDVEAILEWVKTSYSWI